MKPIICLDFDGVIHSYTSGWKGADVIPDPPVTGALEFLREAVKYARVAILSSRSHQPGGVAAMSAWLSGHLQSRQCEPEFMNWRDWWPLIEWPTEKPPALVTLDDRAVQFTGVWPDVQELLKFQPWNKKG